MEDVGSGVLEAPEVTEVVVEKPKVDRTDAIRAGDRLRQIRSRAAKAAREKIVAYKWDSSQEPTKSEAYDILRTRIKSENVVEKMYELGLKVAEEHDLTANRFFFANGRQQTLLSTKGREQPLVMDHDAIVPTEVLHLGDLFSIYDLSVTPLEPEVTFEAFLAKRAEIKSSWLTLGNEFLDKSFETLPHAGWERFLPRFIPGLQPGYTQKQMGQWLGQIHSDENPDADVREYLIQASRNSFKSSVGICWLITGLLNCGSLRLLLVSETTKLSKDFIKMFRSIFEVAGTPTRFQAWHPEHCIPRGEGSVLGFSSPMRTLKLAQDTVAISSLESTVAGQRYDLGWFDDTVSNLSTGTPEMCAKGIQTVDALLKTREANSNSGLTCFASTPWRVGDVHHELIRRNEAALPGEKPMQIKIEPAWTVKPSFKHLPILMLTEDMVDLTFPSRLTFKMLMKEARANLPLMRSQNLVEYFDEDFDSKVTFTREALDKALRPPNAFPLAKRQFRVLCVDPSHSVSRTADYSALAIIDFLETPNEKTGILDNIAFIKDFRLERMKTSDVAICIHDLHQQWRPITPGGELRCVIEKSGDWQSLGEAIQRTYLIRGHALLNVYWKSVQQGSPGASILAKTNRVKGFCEMALNTDRLFFSTGIACIEEVFNQFVKFDGVHRSGSTRKDDAPDCVAIALSTFLPRTQAEAAEEKPDEALLEFERLNMIQQQLLQQHDRVFGSPPETASQFQRNNLEPEAFQGLYQTLGKFNMTRRAA